MPRYQPNPEENDLLVELLEKNERVQAAKQAAYKHFYQNRFNSNFETSSRPSKSSVFHWPGFLQAFGAMSLIAIFLATAWTSAENAGLIGGQVDKMANNTTITSFEDCQKAGGDISELEPSVCLHEGESFTKPNETPTSSTDNSNKSYLAEEKAEDEKQISSGTCSQEIKYCQDGSIVRRDPNNSCQFMLCPEEINPPDDTNNQPQTCSAGFDGICSNTCTAQNDADCCRAAGGRLDQGQCTTNK